MRAVWPKTPIGIERAFIKDEISKDKDLVKFASCDYRAALMRIKGKLSFFDWYIPSDDRNSVKLRVTEKKVTSWSAVSLFYIYIYIKKNWRAAGLELTTIAPSRTIVTDGNC